MVYAELARRRAERATGLTGVRRPGVGVDGTEFRLAYTRTGPRAADTGSTTVVLIPGGPGLASVLPYTWLRRRAAALGLDAIMIEHRGVGLSRRDVVGADLRPSALTTPEVVGDVAAVLDAEGVERAVVVGSSYGTYPAQAFAVEHPERVAALVLDSTVLSSDDEAEVRAHARGLLLDPPDPTPDVARVAAGLHRLIGDGGDGGDGGDEHTAAAVGQVRLGEYATTVFQTGGIEPLGRLVGLLNRGRGIGTRALLDRVLDADPTEVLPYVMEFDLVAEIAFRELRFDDGDGLVFDQGSTFARIRDRYSPFAGEAYDLAARLPELDVPVVVLTGDRDLQTPPTIAGRTVQLARYGRLVPLLRHGHSAMDTHSEALLAVVGCLAAGRADLVAGLELDGLRHKGSPARHLGRLLAATLRADEAL